MKCFKPYDVFISHAAEDKVDLADEIVQSLRQSGLRVWYSSDQLLLGGNIPSNVGKGLRQCRYGVVILSQHALQSSWIIHEVYTMLANSHKDKIIIIPIWHNVTAEQVRQFAPGIADTYSLSTHKGLDVVTSKLQAEIKSKNFLCAIISFGAWIAYKYRQAIVQLFVGILLIAICILIYIHISSKIPPDSFIEHKIRERIHTVNSKISQCKDSNFLSTDSILSLRKSFDQQSPHSDRHAFEFSNGVTPPKRSRVSLKEAGISLNLANVNSTYGFHYFTICVDNYTGDRDNFYLNYSFLNHDSVVYEITNAQQIGSYQYQVTVSYTNFIRAVNVACSYEAKSSVRWEKIKYTGLCRKEKFIFEKKDDEWYVIGYYE